MRRFRWFDADHSDQTTRIDWRMAALILATLFFNFLFAESHNTSLGLWLPLPAYAIFIAVIAALLAALFFAGPALACQSAGFPVMRVIQNSVGTVPALALRAVMAAFLVFWIAALFTLPMYWWPTLSWEVRTSSFRFVAVAAAVLLFLFVTGHQAIRTTSALALFTNKLALVIFLAALFHVREGWGAVLSGSRPGGWYYDIWQGVTELAAYMAPLGLIAASFGPRVGGRREVALTVLWGVAAPLLVTVLLVGLIRTATYHSWYYRPSLVPSVSMALWSHTAHSALSGRLLVAAVTVFGAMRFAGRSLTDIVGVRFPGNWRGWVFVASCIAFISWLAMNPLSDSLQPALDWSGRCLGVASAVITADLIMRTRREGDTKAVDWVALTSLGVGLSVPLFIPHGSVMFTPTPWWYPWLLPSYMVAFFVCSIGRLIQRFATNP